MNYSEKLKDPRWQKKRLQILSRDNWKCQHCGGTKNQLHVHHLVYLKFTDPWDYKDEYLITLCFSCHEQEEQLKNEVNKMIEEVVLSCNTICPIYNYIKERMFNPKPVVNKEIFIDPDIVDVVGNMAAQPEARKLKTLEEIRAQVALEAANNNDEPVILTEEELQKAWEFEINRLRSEEKHSAIHFFKTAKLKIINNNSIEIITENNLQQKFIESERGALGWHLQTYFNNKLLSYRVIMAGAKN